MIHIWGITDKGVVRAENQDSYCFKLAQDDVATAIVCDGMGGAQAGIIASARAVKSASKYLEKLSLDELRSAPGDHLVRAALLANKSIYRKSCWEIYCRGMGTTMVAVAVFDGCAHILNIGDSRAYHIGEEGIRQITRDHSVVEDLVQRGEITPDEARSHPQKNLITRALGSESHVEGDLYEVKLEKGEFILMCTDGLSNVLSDQEILYEVLHGGAAGGCCQRLLDVAISRGAPDNVTAVVIQFV